MGRRLNRRVEIAYKYEDNGAKKNKIDSVVAEVIVPPRAEDTIIVGPKGTVMHLKKCAFDPIDYKDVKFEFSEYFDQESIQASGIRTISNEEIVWYQVEWHLLLLLIREKKFNQNVQ